jgi:hypothetical protein
MTKNNYSKNQSKKLDYKNIKLDKMQEFICESSILLKNNFVSHVNPNLLIQNLRQFIKLINNIKTEYLEQRKDSNFFITEKVVGKPILIYSERKHARYFLKNALKRLSILSNNSEIESLIEIGGIKQLLSYVKSKNKDVLVIFVEKPYKTNIEFCTNHNVYMMSMFLNDSSDTSKMDYKVPLNVNTLKRYFWLVTLISLV